MMVAAEATLNLLESLLVRVRACVFIKLHITAQPRPVISIFQWYTMGAPYGGLSHVCVRKRGNNLPFSPPSSGKDTEQKINRFGTGSVFSFQISYFILT